ncbi:MAG: efflux transporter, family, subunit [Firmicutes bacterium]|nr:efflux transporter, family, subunit [Bacillota bacterium]
MQKRLEKKKMYYGLAALVVLLCVAAGLIIGSSSSTKAVDVDVPLVRTSTIGVGAMNQTNTYSGEVRGRYESQLAFQVGGKIIKRNVELGSIVHAGDVLMQIDAKDIQQNVNISSAQVYSSQSQLKLAENNLSRYRQLYDDGIVSRAAYEQQQSAYDAAVAAARQASAQYAQGSNQLDYSSLYADCDGVVAGIDVEVGQVVGVGQKVITLIKSGEQEVEISIPENKVEELRKASQIKVTFWALPGTIVDGKVREIAPVADKVTRTYKARISLLNSPPELKLGMTATVAVDASGTKPAIYIPLSAIYQTDDVPNVWVVSGDIVNLRPVKLGQYGNNQVQVLEGLNSTDILLYTGYISRRDIFLSKAWTAGGPGFYNQADGCKCCLAWRHRPSGGGTGYR